MINISLSIRWWLHRKREGHSVRFRTFERRVLNLFRTLSQTLRDFSTNLHKHTKQQTYSHFHIKHHSPGWRFCRSRIRSRVRKRSAAFASSDSRTDLGSAAPIRKQHCHTKVQLAPAELNTARERASNTHTWRTESCGQMRAGLRYYLRESRVCVDLSVCRGVSARSDLSGAIYRRSLNNVPIYGKRVRERLQTPNRYSVSGHAHISDVLYCNKVIKCKSHHNSSLDCVYKQDGTREHTHFILKALNKAANAVQCSVWHSSRSILVFWS